ncbi:protein-export chaperone SecB [Weissella cibaria]|uniref:protein-export chaperone SecB n=1 Tax=Weissella cibaria TaxID=137591 RepID=UPI0014308345|nr:protein-export chaperone SecB [Weissella cibaria]
MTEPVIYFEGYKIIEYQYKYNSEEVENSDDGLGVQTALTEDFKKGKVTLLLTYKQQHVDVSMIVVGFFRIREDLNDPQEITNYLKLNGSAMLYPYLRSALSMLTSLDSDKAVLLPTLNMNSLSEQHD